jgi:rubrerythrin
MTWDEYNKLFHKTQANLVAFQPLMQCDHEVIKMIEAAVEAEREACAALADKWHDYCAWEGRVVGLNIAKDIRARGQG